MSGQRKNYQKEKLSQQDLSFIISSNPPGTPGIIQHSRENEILTKKVEEVKEDLGLIVKQLNYIISEADKAEGNSDFKIDEITIGLGFSAKGKIAFIAEAGVEASIEVKFSRK